MGIGGIGMSGLATICQARGMEVSGCDAKLTGPAHRLQEGGVAVAIGHHPSHVTDDLDLLVYSSAVPANHPELAEARAHGIRAISRGELLATLAADQRLIGIAGAHGKTTTSGMAASLLIHAGWDPTAVVGGMMLSLGTNARPGQGAFFVAETDESDGSFLRLRPEIALVTNVDREHLNYYGTFERVVAAFQQFAQQIRPGGTLIRCSDDPVIRQALSHPAQLNYGLGPEADVTAHRIALHGQGSTFEAVAHGRSLGRFALQVPGRHNIVNALAVISLGLTVELPVATMREALAEFQGTERRFQVIRLPRDIWFVEDYAHHPAEIRATLAADATAGRHRLVVFQPHRFSRTHLLEQEFTTCFDDADGLIITDIYSACEPEIPGVSGRRLARLIKSHGHPCVRYLPKTDVASHISRIASPGDTVYFLGAGDIGDLCHVVAAQLHST